MTFRRIGIGDVSLVRRLLAEDSVSAADYAFSYEMPYEGGNEGASAIGEACGCCVYRWENLGFVLHSFPFGGGDKEAALVELRDSCHAEGNPLVLTMVEQRDLPLARKVLGDACEIIPMKGRADYIYSCEQLSTLSGNRFQWRRRLIHRFEEVGPWSYRPISGVSDLDDCRAVCADWNARHKEMASKCNRSIDDDVAAIKAAIDGYFELGLFGGVLRSCDRPVAFALGERLNDRMALLAYERSILSVKGAAAMLAREFVRESCRGFELLNRAWDADDPGLRQTKQMSCPIAMVEKYLVRESATAIQ